MSTKTRVMLTLNQKYDAIMELDKGVPAYKVAEKMKVGKTQIQNLRKRKHEVLRDLEIYAGDSKRKPNVTGNEEINAMTFEWLKNADEHKMPVTGAMIQKHALWFAEKLGKNEFKASKGWLASFLKRHKKELGALSGGQDDLNRDKDNSEDILIYGTP